MNKGNCVNSCPKYEFNSGNCFLENDIARDQNFTSIVIFADSNPDFITICTTPNGNLMSSSSLWGKTLK